MHGSSEGWTTTGIGISPDCSMVRDHSWLTYPNSSDFALSLASAPAVSSFSRTLRVEPSPGHSALLPCRLVLEACSCCEKTAKS